MTPEKAEKGGVLKKGKRIVLQRGPSSFDDAMSEGRIQASQGNFKGAIKSFTKALKFNPANKVANYELGKAYNELGQYGSAIKYFEKAIRRGIRNPDVHVLGNAYQAQGQKSKAKSAYQKYLSKSPNGKYAKRVQKMMSRL